MVSFEIRNIFVFVEDMLQYLVLNARGIIIAGMNFLPAPEIEEGKFNQT